MTVFVPATQLSGFQRVPTLLSHLAVGQARAVLSVKNIVTTPKIMDHSKYEKNVKTLNLYLQIMPIKPFELNWIQRGVIPARPQMPLSLAL